MKKSAYEIVTERIIALLEEGTVPWHRPWAGGQMPQNLISKRNYRGINIFLLASMAYESPYWLTFKQAASLGGSIRKGEKACPVVFWKWLEPDEQKEASARRVPMLRYYSVFNAAQCDGIEDYIPKREGRECEKTPIADAQRLIDGMPRKPIISDHCSTRAFYSPDKDLVNVPRLQLFDCAEEYYSTLFHELVHATGYECRLGRHKSTDQVEFGSVSYSKEELIAEMGAAYLCNSCSIIEHTVDNSVAYIAGWLRRLKNDKTLVIKAAAMAQKAVDFIRKETADQGGEQ